MKQVKIRCLVARARAETRQRNNGKLGVECATQWAVRLRCGFGTEGFGARVCDDNCVMVFNWGWVSDETCESRECTLA